MTKLKIEYLVDALNTLSPGCEFAIVGDTYEGIDWHSDSTSKPAKDLVLQEIARLEAEYTNTEYQRLREKEYPPITDYLDAVVKGDLAQQQTYIDACQAVKAKYPKPEGL